MTTLQTEPKKKTAVRKDESPYLAAFEKLEKTQKSAQEWVQAIRKSGMSEFSDLGFPTVKHEEWVYTNVAPIGKLPFKPVLSKPEVKVSLKQLEDSTFQLPHSAQLVFVDGHFSQELSTIPSIAGVKIKNLAAALNSSEGRDLEKYLGHYAHTDGNAFTSLNKAFFQDGLYVEVAANSVVKEPVYLIYLSTGTDNGATTNPRNIIIARHHSELHIVETYVSLSEGTYFTNAVTEVVVEEGARVEHAKIQNESQKAYHVARIKVHQEKSSFYTSHSVSTGAKLARNDIQVVLNGSNSECVLNGLYLAHDEQLVDHHTVIDHAKAHCNSHEFYHGIIGGHGKGVFNGKIFVRKDAQKTDAKQTNKGMLLSDNATIDTKPQLEIFADDVKCTHGATIGQLDEDAIFYLRARGIGANLARRMLIFAFASDIIDRITIEPVKEKISEFINQRLEEDYAEVKG